MAVAFRSGSRLSKLDAAIEANAVAIAGLVRAVEDRATTETARGLQAQLTRQEGAAASMQAEMTARIERHSSRVDKVEEVHSIRESATAAILGELKAGFASLKESVERLILAEAQARHAPSSSPSILDQLRQFVELQKMIKGVA